MILKDIEAWVAQGESETLEFKKSTSQLNACGETLCGFLNRSGGKILIGVNAQGKVIGQMVGDRTMQEIANLIRRIEPEPVVDIKRVPMPGMKSEVIVLRVPNVQPASPYSYDGRAYIRRGNTTSIMTTGRFKKMLLEGVHATDRWELCEAPDVTLDDLDIEEIYRTVRIGKSMRRLPEIIGTDVQDILMRLGLLTPDNKPNRAAVVLFAKRPISRFSQCVIRLARFKGNTKAEFMDNKMVEGNAFLIYEEAVLFLSRHLSISGRVVPGKAEREEEMTYPLDALRESLVNAICHRDYIGHGGSISLAIYDDCLEIWNPGELAFGLTVDKLKREHESHPWNPNIANVFYRRGMVEAWGRGTQRIVELCTRAGLPEPEFFEQAGSFVVRFLPKQRGRSVFKTNKLSPLDQEILQVLLSGAMPAREIVKRLKDSPSARTVREHLTVLKKSGYINSDGSGPKTIWTLKK